MCTGMLRTVPGGIAENQRIDEGGETAGALLAAVIAAVGSAASGAGLVCGRRLRIRLAVTRHTCGVIRSELNRPLSLRRGR